MRLKDIVSSVVSIPVVHTHPSKVAPITEAKKLEFFKAKFIVTSAKADTLLFLPATIGDLAKVEKYSVNEVYDEIIKYAKKKTGLDFYAKHRQGSYQFTIELDYDSLIAKL
jgi:hypothetical protein